MLVSSDLGIGNVGSGLRAPAASAVDGRGDRMVGSIVAVQFGYGVQVASHHNLNY